MMLPVITARLEELEKRMDAVEVRTAPVGQRNDPEDKFDWCF